MRLALGVDAGGTGSRAVLLDQTGVQVGRGDGAAGNPMSGPVAVRAIGATVRAALRGHDPARVGFAVVGIAGLSSMANTAVRDAFAAEWREIGLTCPVRIVGDAVTAYAAGEPKETRGAVLIAGTGSVAALVDGLDVLRTADGYGWLLGDEGSGVWLGLQAIRSAVRRTSALGTAVLMHTGTRTPDELIAWATRQKPQAYARLAPLVCTTSDGESARIIAEAVERLIATVAELDHPEGPVVLAGGLLTADTPIRRGVEAALGDRARPAGDPVSGAARLALGLVPHSHPGR
ncbi:BadF/BadG/BcrA/BcrD ATPase family protein [Actinoplanes sp. NPDC051470]|uniref:N-acetylglucosamine kinase n=1 Tax=unclassified Actinoplanes TaxID=2626549 RepID=UPI0034197583